MGQVLHGSATTTEAVRRAIQRNQESVRALAERHGVSPTTLQKWRKRQTAADAVMGPKDTRSTTLTPEQEAVVVAFRRHTLLPLDDCLYALQPTIPALTRSSLHRCLQRHGISRLPQTEGDKPDKKRFKAYPIGSVRAHAILQTRLLMDANCRAVLLTPPFYLKGVTDDGLFAWLAHVFEKLGPQARDVLLYNIPSVTAVPLSVDLVGRLRTAFPQVVAGVKDSSGDFAYTERLLAAHGDLTILIGDERGLAAGIRFGGQGAISGLANVCPQELATMIDDARDDPRVLQLVEEVLRHPVVPAVEALVEHRTGDLAWLNVRAPLVALDPATASRLGAACDSIFAAQAA